MCRPSPVNGFESLSTCNIQSWTDFISMYDFISWFTRSNEYKYYSSNEIQTIHRINFHARVQRTLSQYMYYIETPISRAKFQVSLIIFCLLKVMIKYINIKNNDMKSINHKLPYKPKGNEWRSFALKAVKLRMNWKP